MNFAYADAVVCLYRDLTTSKQSLVQPRHITTVNPVAFNAKTTEAITKYGSRGFATFTTLSDVDSMSAPAIHVCGQALYCPHTVRSVGDDGCLVLPFHDLHGTDSIVAGLFPVIFRLGGRACRPTNSQFEMATAPLHMYKTERV